jgi:hypothetical protein
VAFFNKENRYRPPPTWQIGERADRVGFVPEAPLSVPQISSQAHSADIPYSIHDSCRADWTKPLRMAARDRTRDKISRVSMPFERASLREERRRSGVFCGN